MAEFLIDRKNYKAWMIDGDQKIELENVKRIDINTIHKDLQYISFDFQHGRVNTRFFRYVEEPAEVA